MWHWRHSLKVFWSLRWWWWHRNAKIFASLSPARKSSGWLLHEPQAFSAQNKQTWFQGTLDLGQLVPRIRNQQNIVASSILVQRLNLAGQAVECLSLQSKVYLLPRPRKDLCITKLQDIWWALQRRHLIQGQKFLPLPKHRSISKPKQKYEMWPRGASFTGGGIATLGASSIFVPWSHLRGCPKCLVHLAGLHH